MTGVVKLVSLEQRKAAAWATTRPINGLEAVFHPFDARRDELGNIVSLAEHGNRDDRYGWVIEHRLALSQGGADEPANLRAVACRSRRLCAGRRDVAKSWKLSAL